MSHSCQLPSPICLPPAMGSMFLADAVTGSRGADEGKIPVCGKTCTREGVNMNPRDFKKVAPFLGALLLAAVVFTAVRSLL